MNEKRRVLISIILILMFVVLGGIAVYYWYENQNYVSTEDAKVTGDLVKVSPQIAGKLLDFTAEEGDYVEKYQILGHQETINLSDTSIDQSVLRAPIDGIIIKKQANVGEILSVGQVLAYIVDPKKIYVSANIEETKIQEIKMGQKVDVTVDEFGGGIITGKIQSIGQAANSTFSLLPTSTSGTFTKVVQKVPVKIEIDNTNTNLLPGTNAVVKIHIR